MRRMLDPKEAGGSLPSTIEFDKEGNRKATKNLDVGGKLTLKSLVSASNPDGDITNELGGTSALYKHSVTATGFHAKAKFDIYSSDMEEITKTNLGDKLNKIGGVLCAGYIKSGESYYTAFWIYRMAADHQVYIDAYDTSNESIHTQKVDSSFTIIDSVNKVM